MSHYENFKSYHTTFYRYVEPSSITPFTYQVRKRALHASLVIALRHSCPELLDNKGAELFDSNSPRVRKVIKLLKNRIQNACFDKLKLEETLLHIDCLLNEWTLEVRRCNEESLNLRYNPKDNSAEALLGSYGNNDKNIGLWRTLNSMRHVEKTAMFKIVKSVDL